jgi:hypothetical protein
MIDIDDINDEEDVEEEIGEQYSDTLTEKPTEDESVVDWVLNKLSYLVGVPVCLSGISFAEKHNYIPDVKWKAFLLFLAIATCSFLFIKGFLSFYKNLVVILFFIAVCWLGVNSIRGRGYGFKTLQEDYVEVVMNIFKKNGK